MTVGICDNRAAWEARAICGSGDEFLQSWDWGEFQRSAGHEVLRVQVTDAGRVVAQVQGFVHSLGFGLKYLYSPRFEIGDKRYFDELCGYVKKIGFIFWRVEPIGKLSTINYQLSTIPNRQPKDTLIIDLGKSEEELLNAMHSKTRYNIHLAEKKSVRVVEEKNSDIFWQLNTETTTRDAFKSHDKGYYENMLRSPIVQQLTAYLDDAPIASNIYIVFGDTCTYLHGASSNMARNAMAPYLLQWAGMMLGKKNGCHFYDVWGVAPQQIPNSKFQIPSSCFHNYCWEATHPWTGVTRFKAGLGGVAKSYPQGQEIIFRSGAYRLYQLAKRFL